MEIQKLRKGRCNHYYNSLPVFSITILITNLIFFSNHISYVSSNPLSILTSSIPVNGRKAIASNSKWSVVAPSPSFEDIQLNTGAQDNNVARISFVLNQRYPDFLKIPDLDTFRKQAYATQNCYRKRHGADPLEASAELESMSLEWADHLASTGQFEHSQGNASSTYGENLYASSSPDIDGSTSIVDWYSEEKDYNYKEDGFQPSAGHFSQLVWKGSQHCGISYAVPGGDSDSGGMIVVVANYDPAGNSGNYEANVSPPDPTIDIDCSNVAIVPEDGAGPGSSTTTEAGAGGPPAPPPPPPSVTSPPEASSSPRPPPIPPPTTPLPSTTTPWDDSNCSYTENGEITCFPPSQTADPGNGNRPPRLTSASEPEETFDFEEI